MGLDQKETPKELKQFNNIEKQVHKKWSKKECYGFDYHE